MIASKLILFFCFYLLLDNSLGQKIFLLDKPKTTKYLQSAIDYGRKFGGELGELSLQWKNLSRQIDEGKVKVGFSNAELRRFSESSKEVDLAKSDVDYYEELHSKNPTPEYQAKLDAAKKIYSDKVEALVALRSHDIITDEDYIEYLKDQKERVAIALIIRMEHTQEKFKDHNVRKKVKEAKDNGLRDSDIKTILFAEFFEPKCGPLIGGRASTADALLSSFRSGMESIFEETFGAKLDGTYCETFGILQYGNSPSKGSDAYFADIDNLPPDEDGSDSEGDGDVPAGGGDVPEGGAAGGSDPPGDDDPSPEETGPVDDDEGDDDEDDQGDDDEDNKKEPGAAILNEMDEPSSKKPPESFELTETPRKPTAKEKQYTYDEYENPQESNEFQGIQPYSERDVNLAASALDLNLGAEYIRIGSIEDELKRLKAEQTNETILSLSLERSANSNLNSAARIEQSERYIQFLQNLLTRGTSQLNGGQALHESFFEQYMLSRTNAQYYGAFLSDDTDLIIRYTLNGQPPPLAEFSGFANNNRWRYLIARERWSRYYRIGVRLTNVRRAFEHMLAEVENALVLEQVGLVALKNDALLQPEPETAPQSPHEDLR